ncbi:MAG: hypothetical protein GX945_00740 [Lentisphaerae bacterium]|nr:hypothetical protein [Lentisphaerota bacterium]
MRPLTVAVLASVLSLAALTAAPLPQSFPTHAELRKPERWRKNCSGTMTIAFDDDEQALAFAVEFPPQANHWVYPEFTLHDDETLYGADAISFELKIPPRDDYQGIAHANVVLTGEQRYQAPEPGEWHDITVKLPGAADKEREEATFFRLGMNPKHASHRFFVRNIRFHGTPQQRYIAPALATAAPGTVWLEQEEPTFTVNMPLDNLRYVLKDWLGAVLKEDAWPDNGSSPLVFPPMMPGYYLLETSHDDNVKQLAPYSFVVVIDPAQRSMTHRSFFGIDSAQSWLARRGHFACPWYDGDSFKLVSELIYRAGVPHVRERLRWAQVNPSPGEYNYSHYLYNAELLHERGILISGMFHDAPAWAGRKIKLPLDLREVYIFCKKTAEVFGERMGNWEYWNEPDILFAPEPVWDYAASMKAAYLGFKAARPDMPVTIGALCRSPRNAYNYSLFANDIAKYTDLMNLHTYERLASYPKIFAEMRLFMAEHGIADRPLWLTECGTNAEGHATADSSKKGFKKHSPEQEMIAAEFQPKAQILLMFEGVARNYFFVFPPHNERDGRKDWGIMRRDSTVKPSYAAFATITAQLLEATPLGEINTNEQTRAFLFQQPDDTQTLVFWSKSAVDSGGGVSMDDLHAADISLALPAGNYVLTDMVGGTQALNVTGNADATTLRATRFPQYLAGLRGLKADLPPHKPGTALTNNAAADDDLSVIVHLELNADDMEVGDLKSVALFHGKSARGTLTLWNLDPKPKSGRLLVSGATISGLPETINIAPMDKVLFDVVVTPELPPEGFNTSLTISGSFNGKAISRFHLPVFLFGDFLANCDEVKLNTTRPENWQRKDSGTNSTMVYDEAEQAMRFDVSWENPDVDRWFYPEHVLELPEESFAGASMLTFEVKSSQDKLENDFRLSFFVLLTGDPKDRSNVHNISYRAPLHDWETRRVSLDSTQIPLSEVTRFRLGANPVGQQLSYWIRNIRLLKPRQ